MEARGSDFVVRAKKKVKFYRVGRHVSDHEGLPRSWQYI